MTEKIVTESRDKLKVPTCDIIDANGDVVGTYNFPVGGHVVVEDGQTVKTGETLVKIPRAAAKGGDITGGLPRVTELFGVVISPVVCPVSLSSSRLVTHPTPLSFLKSTVRLLWVR